MLWRLYDSATAGLLAALAASMFGIAIVNALLRYLFDNPLVWGEEISRYCMVWGTLVGVALAYRMGAHVSITILTELVPQSLQTAWRVVCHLLVLAVAAMLWRSGSVLTGLLGAIQAPSSGIRMSYVYLSLEVGAVMLAIEAGRLLYADIRLLARRRPR
ncbi:MAG TPA: TRAP transporter small permease [Alphaproteobacteria bacterium]|nr:TRAP transporter small permease [Alphaproteobacteria bacterium]